MAYIKEWLNECIWPESCKIPVSFVSDFHGAFERVLTILDQVSLPVIHNHADTPYSLPPNPSFLKFSECKMSLRVLCSYSGQSANEKQGAEVQEDRLQVQLYWPSAM